MRKLIPFLLFAVAAHAATIFPPGPFGIVPSPYTTNWNLDIGRTWIYADYTSGLDTRTGLTPATAVKTLTNAVRLCSIGGGIFVLPGTNNCETNSIVMKTNSILRGAGTNASFIIGWADLSAQVGAQIVPRDNCQIESLTIICNTNAIETNTPALTTGTWSGVGFTQDAKAPNNTIAGTNISLNHLLILNGIFDCVHVNHHIPWSMYCNDVVTLGIGNFNFVSQNGTHQKSFASLRNCKAFIIDTMPANMFTNFTFWTPPSFITSDTYTEIVNCEAYVVTNGFGRMSVDDPDLFWTAVAPGMFNLTGLNSTSNNPQAYIDGGRYVNPYFPDPIDFNRQTNIWGHASLNATNYARLSTPAQFLDTFTKISTNFVQGLIYSNFYGGPINISVNIRATTAAAVGGGDAMMDIQEPAGTLRKRVGIGAGVTMLATTNNYDMSWVVPVNGTYTVTNTITAGAGYAVSVNSGQITIY